MKRLFFLTGLFTFLTLWTATAQTIRSLTVKGDLVTAPTNIIVPGNVTISNGITLRVNVPTGVPFTLWLPANAVSNGLQIFNSAGTPLLTVSSNGTLTTTQSIAFSGVGTNIFTGTHFTGSAGDVLTLGPLGLYLATPTGGGGGGTASNAIANINGLGTNTTLYGWTAIVAPLTNTSTFEQQGAQSNASSLNITGPLSVYAAHTNRSTVRNMAGVTNDSNTRMVGAVEHLSTVTNSSSVNTAGGSTNYAAVENRSSVTNIGLTSLGGGLLVSIGQTNSYLTPSRAVVTDANNKLISATGTPDGTKYLRDDGTYAVPPGTGGSTYNPNQFDTTGAVDILSDALVTNLNIRGTSPFATLVGDDFRATNTAQIQGTLKVTGASSFGGTVTATNAIIGQSSENLTGALNVGGATTLSNTLVVVGAIQGQSSLNVNGSLGLGGNVIVTNSIIGQSGQNLTGALNVGGATAISNSLQVQAAANITGASTHGGTATFTNNIVGQSGENLTGQLNLGGALIASNTVNITGASTHGGNATFTNAVQVQGAQNITGALNVGGATILTNSLATQSTVTNAGAVNNGGIITNWASTVLSGPIQYTWTAISASDIDWSSGNSRSKTLSADTTFTFSNTADDRDLSVALLQDGTGTRSVTWPGSIVWINSTNQAAVPTVNTNAGYYTLYHFWKRSGTVFAEGPSSAASIFMVALDSGTASSADLAAQITDETGSGGLVFSNAPSISSLKALNWLSIQGPTTNTSTLEQQGAQTNGGALNVTGPLRVFSAVTNETTLRQKGGQTNDANLQVVGAIVGQSTENLTGALNVGGASIFTNTITGQGAVQLQSTLNVTGAENIGGAVIASNTVAVQGAAQFQSTVNITGASTFGGASTFTNGVVNQSTENVTGAVNIGGLLTTTNGIANQSTTTNTGAANFAAAFTNWGPTTFMAAFQKKPLLVSSLNTTNQIDFTLQNSYRWTNMVTNIVLQLTNMIEGGEIDYYFTGATNGGQNYTVYLTVPSPSGVSIHWGGNSPTNGATSFAVTNNTRHTMFTKVWLEYTNGVTTTNLEAYWQYLPK